MARGDAPIDEEPQAPTATAAPQAPGAAFREAVAGLGPPRLAEILARLGRLDPGMRPGEYANALVESLAEGPRALDDLPAGPSPAARRVLGLLARAEATAWPASGVALAAGFLGDDPAATLQDLMDLGLIVPRATPGLGPPPIDAARLIEDRAGVELVAHPAVVAAARTVLPDATPLADVADVRQVREADGLEPVLRLAALWQRADEAPMRQTQQGTLYKRDRDRLDEDPTLVGPIADALGPLPDPIALWLALARAVGLLVSAPGSDRLGAAPAAFWGENAVHLPQMIATAWLGLHAWSEVPPPTDDAPPPPGCPALRLAALLWLATLEPDRWAALDDLDDLLDRLRPGWDRLAMAGNVEEAEPKPSRGKTKRKAEAPPIPSTLEAVLLGAAYPLGLVRAAEEVPSGRRVVQITDLGRYVLALGPPPPGRPAFPHFLFVQPNFEIIAYRQGLSPSLVGQLSRFALWTQLGAALELRLTPGSVYRGLEGGLTPEAMLDRLAQHSARPLPAGVAEAVRTWAGRRERLTYYAAATLVEFASPEALEAVLTSWPAGPPPLRVSDRLLLVEDDATIPWSRLRSTGSRDYRRPPAPCLEVEPDGVTLALDLGRSDLLVDAELAQFADELPPAGLSDPSTGPRRRFRVSPGSLSRALADGLTTSRLARWFEDRTGGPIPPALRLLLHAAGPDREAPALARPFVLTVPSPEWLDGLFQHPATRDYLGERLGPRAVVIPEEAVPGLSRALAGLGLTIGAMEGGSSPKSSKSRGE